MCSWIKYAIGKLSPAQQKYSAYDLELLAIYEAVRRRSSSRLKRELLSLETRVPKIELHRVEDIRLQYKR